MQYTNAYANCLNQGGYLVSYQSYSEQLAVGTHAAVWLHVKCGVQQHMQHSPRTCSFAMAACGSFVVACVYLFVYLFTSAQLEAGVNV